MKRLFPPADGWHGHARRGRPWLARRPGFSVVELLVVVAILSVLLSIVVPWVGRARMLARQGVCCVNLKHLQNAYQMYSDEFDSKTLPYVYVEGVGLPFEHFWMEVLSRYHDDMDRIRLCPSTTKLKQNGWGTTWVAWGPTTGGFIRQHYGSYAINGWMYNMGWDKVHHVGMDDRDYESTITQESALVPVFCDSSWVDAWPHVTDTPCPNLDLGGQYAEQSMWRVCVARHGMAINASFVDGSSRKVPLDDLWVLNWHKGWVPDYDVHVPGPDE